MTDIGVDVAIVGGGIVGLSSALELQNRGKTVAIIDPDVERGRASFGNAGVISRGSIFPLAGPGIMRKLPRYALDRDIAVRVRLAAFPEFASWLPRFFRSANETAWRSAAAALNPMVAASYDRHIALAELVGAGALIRRNGYMRLYRAADGFAASALEREVLGHHGVRVEHVREGEIYELEPHLVRRFKSALLFPDSASVESPGELVDLYKTAFVDRGGVLVTGHAASLEHGPRNVAVRTEAGIVTADIAVLAAGAWSARFARKLGYRFPLVAERGYHLHLRPKGNAMLNRPVFDAAGGYVMSPMGNTIRVLSGVELARPDDPPDPRQIEAVVADARRSLPLQPSSDHQVWMGSRPSTPDGLPVLGFAGNHERLVFAFGHGHIGFGNGPITGQIVAQLITGQDTSVPIEAFSPRRFGA